jgi:hypothetical protein
MEGAKKLLLPFHPPLVKSTDVSFRGMVRILLRPIDESTPLEPLHPSNDSINSTSEWIVQDLMC